MKFIINCCHLTESDDEFHELMEEATKTEWHMPAILSLKQQANSLNQGAAKTGEAVKSRMNLLKEQILSQMDSLSGERGF